MRPLFRLVSWLSLLALGGCQGLVEPDVEYVDCIEPGNAQTERFDSGDSLQSLRDRCWRYSDSSAGVNVNVKAFVGDGDLVMRTAKPVGSARDEWTDENQGPFLHRVADGDFVVVARVEALDQSNASHCLSEKNRAGLAVRSVATPSAWALWTLRPYLWPGARCDDDEIDSNNPTAEVLAATPSGAVGQVSDVGDDGEADIAICRVAGSVSFYYRDVLATGSTVLWKEVSTTSDVTLDGPTEVGATVHGLDGKYDVEGHYPWLGLVRGPVSDGCSGALDSFELPEDEP